MAEYRLIMGRQYSFQNKKDLATWYTESIEVLRGNFFVDRTYRTGKFVLIAGKIKKIKILTSRKLFIFSRQWRR